MLIASAVFAIAITGLAVALNRLIDANTVTAGEQRLRNELESRLAAARVDPELKPGMNTTEKDGNGITYARNVEEITLENGEKDPVAGLWKISLTARRGDEDLGTVAIFFRPQ